MVGAARGRRNFSRRETLRPQGQRERERESVKRVAWSLMAWMGKSIRLSWLCCRLLTEGDIYIAPAMRGARSGTSWTLH